MCWNGIGQLVKMQMCDDIEDHKVQMHLHCYHLKPSWVVCWLKSIHCQCSKTHSHWTCLDPLPRPRHLRLLRTCCLNFKWNYWVKFCFKRFFLTLYVASLERTKNLTFVDFHRLRKTCFFLLHSSCFQLRLC